MITGLLALPIFVIAGGAVDITRATTVRAQLYEALDATGLAAAKAGSLSDEELREYAERFFSAAFPERSDISVGKLHLERVKGNVIVSNTARLNTFILKLVGQDTLTVSATTEVTRDVLAVEVVMALDNTGSMAGSKISDLRKAAKDAVRILYESVPSGIVDTVDDGPVERLRISLVPFVTAVNIKNEEYDTDWMDGADGRAAKAKYHGANFLHVDSDGKADARVKVNHFDLYKSVGANGTDWKGCVEARPNGYDTDDTEPKLRDPDTLWVPYFWPDEYDCFDDACGGSRATHVSTVNQIDAQYSNNEPDQKTSGNPRRKDHNWTFISDKSFTSDSGSAKNKYALVLDRTFRPDGDIRTSDSYLGTSPGLSADAANGSKLREWLLARGITNEKDEFKFRAYYPGWWNGSKYVGRYDLSPKLDESPTSKVDGEDNKFTFGPSRACPRALVPLVNDRARIDSEIDKMEPYNEGGTNIAAGLAWAWRVLSPTAPFTGGASYDNKQVQKFMILLTDGENVVRGPVSDDTYYKSDYYPYGYLRDERLGNGVDKVNEGVTAVNAKVVTLCERVKGTGIRVYTIAFNVNNSTIRKIMRDCATEPSLAYDTSAGDDLGTAFRQIAEDIANLHISK